MVADPLSLKARFEREFRPALMAFFLRRLGSHAEAEDMTHEVYMRLAQSHVDDVRSGQAFLFKVAANLLRDRARREAVRTRYAAFARTDDLLEVDDLDPFRIAAGRQSLAILINTLGEMPERTRQIFLLYRAEQVSRQAIAESFGISVSAVEKHIHRALALLASRIGDDR